MAVQDEFVQVLTKVAATSLDVGHKQNQDNQFEKTRAAHVQQTLTNKADAKRKLHMDSVTLAVLERLELFKRGRGTLCWETDASQEQASFFTHQRDEKEFSSNLEHHRDSLVAKAAQLRKQAKQTMIHDDLPLPLTSAQWVVWLDNYDDISKGACRQAPLKGDVAMNVLALWRPPKVLYLGWDTLSQYLSTKI